MPAPEHIRVEHTNGQTKFTAFGSLDISDGFGARYVRADIAERSIENHNHEFAVIKELWDNWPENRASEPMAASPATLRKHALIATGFCDTDIIVFDTDQAAQAAVPNISRMATRLSGYCVTVVSGNVVSCTTPHSQSKSKMGNKAFKESKAAVLDWIKCEIGIEK